MTRFAPVTGLMLAAVVVTACAVSPHRIQGGEPLTTQDHQALAPNVTLGSCVYFSDDVLVSRDHEHLFLRPALIDHPYTMTVNLGCQEAIR
jgi:hypothetical protein